MEETEVLREGATGGEVGRLKSALRILGFDPGGPDPVFDSKTAEAVSAFQKQAGLPVNGIAGREVMDEIARRMPPSAEQAKTTWPPLRVFISSSHADQRMVKGLMTNLGPLLQSGLIEAFLLDEQLKPGANWQDEIARALERVDIFLAMISANYLASEYTRMETELAIRQSEDGRTLIIPIILRPADWKNIPLAQFQALPRDGKPVSTWRNQNEAWAEVAAELRRLVEGLLARQLSSGRAFAGYTADTLRGKDLLDRQKLISDVARWLSVRSLQTPLAIGLFGDWGSGKSFFMQRLQEEIDAIAHRAAARESKKPETAFCSHIVQVAFNAWLYSDSDIWPSLASAVFKAVAGVDPNALGDKTSMEELRQYWAKENPDYAAAAERKREAAKRADQAQKKVKSLDEEIGKSRERLIESANSLGGRLGDEAAQALKAGEALQDVISARKRTLEALKQLASWQKITLSILALVGAVAAIVTLVKPSVYAAITAFIGLAASITGLTIRATNFMHTAIKEDRRSKNLKLQRQQACNQWLEATKAQEEADAQLDLLARRGLLDVYASGQADLWRSRERLGEVTEIRQAFARLSAIITQTQNAGSDVPPIQRIIVYIDDLDRCAPNLVVKVLEAIKLLMDLENFVVIVGVDSRWLFRSLQVKFRDLLSSSGLEAPEPEDGWAATPQNYLEKIFQFSLVLPQMTSEGYNRLVSGLFEPQTKHEEPEDSATGQFPPEERGTLAGWQRMGAGRTASSEEIDDRPSDLVLQKQELEMLRSLAPLIQTPRAAKRLTNIYRLLRVTVGESPLLDRESYVPVLLLLGIIVGYPRQSCAFLTALEKSDPSTAWTEFIQSLTPKKSLEPDRSQYQNSIREDLSQLEADEWIQMTDNINAMVSTTDRRLLTAEFYEWLQPVAAYTFHPWVRGQVARRNIVSP